MKNIVVTSIGVLMLMTAAPAWAESTTPAAPAMQSQPFSVDTPIPQLVSNPAANAILQEKIPDLINNPQVQSAPISLRQLAQYAQGALTDDKLNEINTALAAVH